MAAHGAEFRAAGAAGQEQQHRVVGARAADHQAEVVAVDLHVGELGDASGQRLTVRTEDRRGAPGTTDSHREHREQHDRGDDAHARRSLRCAGPGCRPTPGGAQPEPHAEEHRHHDHQRHQAASGDERDQAVEARLRAVDGGAVEREPAELVADDEGRRGGQQRPPRTPDDPREQADEHAEGEHRECLEAVGGAARLGEPEQQRRDHRHGRREAGQRVAVHAVEQACERAALARWRGGYGALGGAGRRGGAHSVSDVRGATSDPPCGRGLARAWHVPVTTRTALTRSVTASSAM